MKWEQPEAKTYNIEVKWEPLTRSYFAEFEPAPGITWCINGPSVAFVLRELSNRFEESGKYGSDEEVIEKLVIEKVADCNICSAPIFFARLPPPSEKHLAFDVEPIEASKIRGARSARFAVKKGRFKGQDRTFYHVIWMSPTVAGPVWVAHPEVCGGNRKAPLSPALRERWQERRQQFTISDDEKNNAIAGLLEINREIEGTFHGSEPDLSGS